MTFLDTSINTTTGCAYILLIEDNTMVQKATKILFESLGFSIDIASSGEEGLRLFQPGKYQLILMDVGLPGIDGYETTRQIRKMESGTTFHVPIIGVSAHALQDSPMNQEAGLEEMLSKPLLIHQAKELLVRYKIT